MRVEKLHVLISAHCHAMCPVQVLLAAAVCTKQGKGECTVVNVLSFLICNPESYNLTYSYHDLTSSCRPDV